MEFYQSIYYEQLKRDLVKKSGVAMNNFSDTLLLAAVMESAKFSISSHTLARFFGFMPRRKLYPSTLQIICNYLGFDHFEAYRTFVEQTHNRSLLGSSGLFENGLFSPQSFELSIQLMDVKNIQNHIECIDFSHEKIEYLAHLTGFLVRNSTQLSELLEILIQTTNGKRLFYERFVDEDDPNGYFSLALKTHYLKRANTTNNRLFYFCFLIANASYHNKIIDSDWINGLKKERQNIDLQTLHFHEISRVFETQILVDFHLNKLTRKRLLLLQDEILSTIEPIDNHGKAWILARVLKALAFTNQLAFVMQNEGFCNCLMQVCKQTDVASIGELIIQLVYYRYSAEEKNELHMPLSLQSNYFQNEYHTRLSTEAATRSLFGSEQEKKNLQKSLQTYTQKTGTSWVLNILNGGNNLN
jgi:hypothetical protein